MSYYLGVDIGGTNLRAAVGTEGATIHHVEKIPTPQNTSGSVIIGALLDLVERVCEGADLNPTSITAATVGSAGLLDRDKGTITASPNILASTDELRITDHLAKILETDSIRLKNDAICSVHAEQTLADTPTQNLLYLTLSTGIGAGVVVDHELLFSDQGNGAEVGHMTIDPQGEMMCGCGRHGHWEAYCGGANIPEYASTLYREHSPSTDLPVSHSERELTAKHIFDAVGNDPLADLVIERINRWNTIGFANLVHAFAPNRIAVGGAVALHNPTTVLEPIRSNLSDHVMIETPTIEITEHGDNSVLKGALLFAEV